MRRFSVIAAVVGSVLVGFSPAASADAPVLVDKVLVIVHGSPVLRSEVQRRLRPYVARAGDKVIDREAMQALEREMQDRIIEERLIAREAKRRGVVVSDADVDAALKAVAAQGHVSLRELFEEAQRAGMSQADYTDEVRRQLTDARWVFRLVPDPKERNPQVLERERNKALKDLRAKAIIEVSP